MAPPTLTQEEASPLLDKVPPEIRLMIFRRVLRTSFGVAMKADLRLTELGEPNSPINTSLFQVNRLISQEAQDAFFQENAIRWSSSLGTLHGLDDIRHVGIVGITARYICHGCPSLQEEVCRIAGALPKLQSVTLECDTLAKHSESMREFSIHAVPKAELRCLRIGVFEVILSAKPHVKLILKNFRLASTLSEARKLASEHSASELLTLGFRVRRRDDRAAYSLAETLKSFRISRMERRGKNNTNLTFADEIAASAFGDRIVYTNSVPKLHPRLPIDAEVEDLTVEEHGAEVVEWASGILAFNF